MATKIKTTNTNMSASVKDSLARQIAAHAEIASASQTDQSNRREKMKDLERRANEVAAAIEGHELEKLKRELAAIRAELQSAVSNESYWAGHWGSRVRAAVPPELLRAAKAADAAGAREVAQKLYGMTGRAFTSEEFLATVAEIGNEVAGTSLSKILEADDAVPDPDADQLRGVTGQIRRAKEFVWTT
jgi:hypothetical protein